MAKDSNLFTVADRDTYNRTNTSNGLGLTTGTGSQGIQALYKVPTQPIIDFMAMERGAQMRNDVDWRNQLRDRDRRLLDEKNEDEVNAREATAYLAPLRANFMAAVQAGMSPTDFYAAQIRQMENDPGFHSLTPESQAAVLGSVRSSALGTMNQEFTNGNYDNAERIANAFGFTNPYTSSLKARMSGDSQQMADYMNSRGMNATVNPDGSLNVMNVGNISQLEAASILSNARGNTGLLAPQLNDLVQARQLQAQNDEMNQQLRANHINPYTGEQTPAPAMPSSLNTDNAVPSVSDWEGFANAQPQTGLGLRAQPPADAQYLGFNPTSSPLNELATDGRVYTPSSSAIEGALYPSGPFGQGFQTGVSAQPMGQQPMGQQPMGQQPPTPAKSWKDYSLGYNVYNWLRGNS